MLFSIVAVLAMVQLALAASPAAATYCYEDNLLRAFQHTSSKASSYCATSTAYPPFLAVRTYPPTRLSSACSCFSRFPTEGFVPAPTPTCVPGTLFEVSGITSNGYELDFLVTVDLTQTCIVAIGFGDSSGNSIVNVCGTYNGNAITYIPGSSNLVGGDCYPIGYQTGFDFSAGGNEYFFHIDRFIGYDLDQSGSSVDMIYYQFVAVSCGRTCPTP